MNRTLKELILAAEFAAIISVLSQMTIPFGLVPLTGQTFAIGLTATFLGRKLGLISVTVYLLLGLIGLPVFSEMTGGIAVLFGPTGGYLIGFLFQTWLTGWMIEKNRRSLLIRNLCQSNGLSYRISLWDDLAEDKWRPYFYNCICQWSTAFFTAGSNQSNWSSLYRCLDEKKRLNRFLRTN